MPVLDMPLSELRNYTGSSPCPRDIDVYWDKALSDMKAIDANVIITAADFNCDFAACFDLTFTGLGGSRVYAKLLKPLNLTRPAPALLKFHGYSASSGDWSDHLAHVAAGYIVAALDCRGQGGKSQDLGGASGNTLMGHIVRGLEDGPESLYFRSVFSDTAQLAGIVLAMDNVDAARVMATGGSQGGGLTIACAALEPRVSRALAVYPFLSDYKRVWDMDLDINAYDGLRQYFRRFDPRHEHEDRFFDVLSYIDIQNLAHRIKADVTIVTGLMDDVCPPSTQFAVYNRIQSVKKIVLYPDFGHEGLPDVNDLLMRQLMELKG